MYLLIYSIQNLNIIKTIRTLIFNILSTDSDVWDYKDLEDYNAIDYPYLKKEEMSFMPSRFRRSIKRSIIDECCRRPCYLSELKTYCASQ